MPAFFNKNDMKVRFLKDLFKNKKGDETTIPDGVANYWLLYGVVEQVKEKKAVAPTEKKKSAKPISKKDGLQP